ncbi:pentatricopeptide repeat-containing protein At5g50990 [Diospyros lotus]|uniref:pentatricopeptide repeat-containing protein At5g50990 n=1 Tax=Diospyros lotus TaxID=55363 RepID=UPI0022588DB5|nr:pentatricopeptide repeat-containing protein At5g50990 [Diospyros lotus]XP_052182183.1 pentatricopeptide repeat-containing protein At5g50990 [Diospyros lotus]
MLRLARTGLGLSSSSSSLHLSRRLNHPPKLSTFAGNTTFITADNSDVASLNSTSFSPREFDRQKTDYQTLFRVLEACKFSPNLGAVSGTHSAVVKLGYGTYQSLILSLISVYISSGCPNLARHLLNETPSSSFDVISANLIITSFMRIGDIDTAKKVFHDMPIRDVVSWNSMIGGYVKNAHFEEALRIFQEMMCSNVEPDGFTFASAISGCARLGARDYAKWIHGIMIEKKIELNNILGSALIDMYSRCGRIETAKEIFEAIKRDDISIWNAMINGLAVHGLAIDAIAIFSCMEAENVSPDSITFLGIFTACSHCGLVEQGQKFFNLMMFYTVQPQLEHYGAMVDLLGRAGHLDEAYALIKEMPMEPDIVIWRALLSACRTWRNSDLGEVAIKKIENLNSGDYVLLSNIYCSVNKWDSAERVRSAMRKNGIRKNSGKSWIEMAGVIHKFKAGDQSHLERGAIYKVLESLIQRTKLEGFIPTIELVLMDVSDEEKEENLNYHSEKLALAYGILKTSPGMEIQIAKNLRTCLDCHSWMKIVSRMLNRVIIVRDRIRFHRFQGGLCTCGDYW